MALQIVLVILFFTLSKSYAIEDVTEFTDAINEASENFNSIIADKLKDALDAKKIDLASTMTDRASKAEES